MPYCEVVPARAGADLDTVFSGAGLVGEIEAVKSWTDNGNEVPLKEHNTNKGLFIRMYI